MHRTVSLRDSYEWMLSALPASASHPHAPSTLTVVPTPEVTGSKTQSSQQPTALIPIQAKSQTAPKNLCAVAQHSFLSSLLFDILNVDAENK